MKKILILLAVAVLFVPGCESFWGKGGQSQTSNTRTETPNTMFYTFPDIPVPKELSFERDRSFIYETAGLKTGVLVLTGNVDLSSLENYFKVNMVKSGWKYLNSYKYGSVILNFLKEDRASTIRITRETFTTQSEIWVGPIEKGSSPPMTTPKTYDLR